MYIYLITNKLNGKRYVGQTVQEPKKRWERHCSSHPFKTAIHLAIKKYGKENFLFEVIDEATSLEELGKKEIDWIEKLGTYGKGYNLSLGGDRHAPMTEETKRKISKKLKGIKKPNFAKIVICMNSGQKFNSETEACEFFKLKRRTIAGAIRNGYKVHGSLIFRYEEE